MALDADAADNDGDALTYSATGLPPGITINASTGVISGTLSATSAGVRTVTVTVSDGTGTDTDTFVWTVTATNATPVVDSATIAPAGPTTGQTLTATVTSHDPDGDALTTAYQWTRNGADIAGATSSTLNLATAGNGDKGDLIRVRVTVNDGQATSAPLTVERADRRQLAARVLHGPGRPRGRGGRRREPRRGCRRRRRRRADLQRHGAARRRRRSTPPRA